MWRMDVFAAIAQPTRRSILEMLADDGQLTATQIARRFRVSPPAISQHLKILREARVVFMRKNRQQRIYEINPEAVHQVEDWAKQMEALWQDRFDRLEQLLKEEDEQVTHTATKGRKEQGHGRA
jgi:DNA-binding transcriptional ArsR family regulator